MKRLVLDASVLLKLFFEESHSDAAHALVRRAERLLAPDLIWAEAANVVWKRLRAGALDNDVAARLLAEMRRVPIETQPAHALVTDALDIAIAFDRTVYDSLYLALAVRSRSIMATADKRLVNALTGTPLAKRVRWVGG